ARALGVLVVHVTEAYTPDYRELDWTNPGRFHRSQILRQSWKMGTRPVELFEPLRPGPGDKDIVLPNRIQASGFGGNGLDAILRGRGIKNVAVGGFTADVCVYATVLSAFDLGYHVYAVKDAIAPFYGELSEPWSSVEFTYPAAEPVPGIIVRLRDGTLYAASRICPHQSCQLLYKTDSQEISDTFDVEAGNPVLACPCHFSVFDLAQKGKVL